MPSVDQVLDLLAAAAGPPRLRRETVPLDRAVGRVLAQDVRLDHDAPPFDRATMDGFALRAADAAAPGAVLTVVGRGRAGAQPERPIGPGETAAVMTGAPIPPGADAVVPVERTRPRAGRAGAEASVEVLASVPPGDCVARRGEQAALGEVVAAAGSWVHPGLVGVLATAGRAEVEVAARPRVAVLSTGDELLPAAHALRPASIRDSNSPTLVAQCARAGAEGVRAGPVPDDEPALRAAVEEALASCDLLCVTGGVSVGDRDLVPSVLASCGVERLFHRWDAKPGGPLWAGRRGETLVFGLPGNPGASFVAFEVAVVPALRTRMGLPFAPRATVPAVAAGRFPVAGARRLFVPVDLGFPCDGPPLLVATPVRSLGSGDPFAWGRAAGLAVVREAATPGPAARAAPPGLGAVPAVAPLPCVEVVPLGTLLGRCAS